MTDDYWHTLDKLIDSCPLVIDRPKGSHHPRFSHLVYPLDYGYLKGTQTIDGGGIDIWRGEGDRHQLSGIILTVDLRKRDAEIKILLGCTDEEIKTILAFHNDNDMRGYLVRRPKEKK